MYVRAGDDQESLFFARGGLSESEFDRVFHDRVKEIQEKIGTWED